MTLLDSRKRWLGPEQRTRLRLGARRHWVFLTVFGLGVLLRIITQVAYRPALLFIDSYRYLENLHDLSPSHAHPIGYEVLLLRPVLSLGNLATVAALQHILGLAMGVAIYAVLVRLGARTWIAGLASVPVLLDAYQLHIEQNIMSEVLFQALILGAVVLLLWRRPPTLPVLAIAGGLFGLSATVRVVGAVLIVPAIVFVLIVGTGSWRRLIGAGTIALAFAVPVGMYAGYYWVETGRIGLTRGDALLLYGRAATIVDCRSIDLPDNERVLCPNEPLGQRRGVNDYAHHSPYPGRLEQPHGENRDKVLRDFARRVFVHQPFDLARHIVTDFGKGFAWPRRTFAGDATIERWQFQEEYPTFDQDPARTVRQHGDAGLSVVSPLATFLRGYQLSVGYVPGPLLGLAFVLGVVAAAGVGRARRSGLQAACLLTTLCGLSVLFAADVFHFSWRYQLPALVLAPLAGGLALTALTGRPEPERQNVGRTVATTDARG
jgi:hypothetical protein